MPFSSTQAETLRAFVHAHPGCSSEEIALALQLPYSSDFHEALLRSGRSLDVGPDERSRWWRSEHHDGIRHQFDHGLPASARG